jgi:hypothetical protein
MMRWLGMLLLTVLAVAAGGGSVRAQEDLTGAGFITPFPENDLYRLHVIGDSLAEGLTPGLTEALADDTRLQVRRSRPLSLVARSEADEEMKAFEDSLVREAPHIAVVMLGVNDRVPFRAVGSRRIMVGSDDWKREYGRRVDRVMKALKRRNVAVYWVGLPILRRSEANEDAQMMNEIYRERAYLNGQKYIDVFEGFADEGGNYNSYGPDLAGKNRLLREADGIHFTWIGNRKLAHFIEREVRRDVGQARSARNIPLAGGEADQRRVAAMRAPAQAAGQAGGDGAAAAGAKGGKEAGKAGPAQPKEPLAGTGSGDQKADNGRVTLKALGRSGKEEAVTVELLRPALSASVIALMTRRESADKPSQMGETLTDTLPGGTLVLSSIQPANDIAGPGGRRRLSPTQAPYYRVLIKGDRLAPRPGRVDDFRWPRPDEGAVGMTAPRVGPPQGQGQGQIPPQGQGLPIRPDLRPQQSAKQ